MLKITKLTLISFIFSQQLFAPSDLLLKKEKKHSCINKQSWIDRCCLFLFSHITNGVAVYFPLEVSNYGAIAHSPRLTNRMQREETDEGKKYTPFQKRPEVKRPPAIRTDYRSLKQTRPKRDPQSRFRVVTPGADELFTEFLSQK